MWLEKDDASVLRVRSELLGGCAKNSLDLLAEVERHRPRRQVEGYRVEPDEQDSVQRCRVVVKGISATEGPSVLSGAACKLCREEGRCLGDGLGNLCGQRVDGAAGFATKARKNCSIRTLEGPVRKQRMQAVVKLVVVGVARSVGLRPHDALALDDQVKTTTHVNVERLGLRDVADGDVEALGVPVVGALQSIQVLNEGLKEPPFAAAAFG
jgi:hypothetical protein